MSVKSSKQTKINEKLVSSDASESDSDNENASNDVVETNENDSSDSEEKKSKKSKKSRKEEKIEESSESSESDDEEKEQHEKKKKAKKSKKSKKEEYGSSSSEDLESEQDKEKQEKQKEKDSKSKKSKKLKKEESNSSSSEESDSESDEEKDKKEKKSKKNHHSKASKHSKASETNEDNEDEELPSFDFGKTKQKKTKADMAIKIKTEKSGCYHLLTAKLSDDDFDEDELVSSKNSCDLYDLDETSFLIVSDMTLTIEFEDKTKAILSNYAYKIDQNTFKKGYRLYKNNYFHIKYLDQTFVTQKGDEEISWRDCLKRSFKEPKEKSADDKVIEKILLWEGKYKKQKALLFEYSPVCLAFVTPITIDSFGKRLPVRIGTNSYTGYYIPKTRASQSLEGIVEENFGSKYIQSEPTKVVAEYPIILKTVEGKIKTLNEDGEKETTEFKLKVYDFSEKAFGFYQITGSEEDEIDFSSQGFKSCKICNKEGYIFPKMNEKLVAKFKKLTSYEPVSAPISEFADELESIIPSAKTATATAEPSIELSILSVLSLIEKLPEDFKVFKKQLGVRVIVYGKKKEIEKDETLSELEELLVVKFHTGIQLRVYKKSLDNF